MEVIFMLGENIKILRKQKGLSQETLAQQLNVVRQTVSKWENGTSVPDAEMLKTISELFEVPVSTLLGSTITQKDEVADSGMDEVAKQLAILNEQLANRAVRRRKTIKRVVIGLVIAVFLLIAVWFAAIVCFKVIPRQNAVYSTTWIEGTLNGETHLYCFTYDENFRIHESGGDSWIANHILAGENYDDANVALAQIEDYFIERGGTVVLTEEPPETEIQ